jgi:hypothetical protein
MAKSAAGQTLQGRQRWDQRPTWRWPRACIVCGKKFAATPIQKFCSVECADRGRVSRRREIERREAEKKKD